MADRKDDQRKDDAPDDDLGEAGLPGDAGPDEGRMRTGPDQSKSLKYSQEVTSPDDGRPSTFFRLENPSREDA